MRVFWQKLPLLWRLAGPGLLLALGVAALLQGRWDGRLHLYFLDVGPGNAILVVTPSGRRVLVDGGPDPTALLSRLGRRLPFWQRELDLVVLTETSPDRMAGPVAAVERYRPHAAGRPGRVRPGPPWERWQALLDRQGVVPSALSRGALLELGDGVTIEVIFPDQDPLPGITPGGRDDALVLRLGYGDFRALLPTAAGPAGQRALLATGLSLSSTLLLIPRQADEEALAPEFLRAVQPAIAVASAGSGYHQEPDARVLAMVERAGIRLYRTDRQGMIELVTDGREVWVRTDR